MLVVYKDVCNNCIIKNMYILDDNQYCVMKSSCLFVSKCGYVINALPEIVLN